MYTHPPLYSTLLNVQIRVVLCYTVWKTVFGVDQCQSGDSYVHVLVFHRLLSGTSMGWYRKFTVTGTKPATQHKQYHRCSGMNVLLLKRHTLHYLFTHLRPDRMCWNIYSFGKCRNHYYMEEKRIWGTEMRNTEIWQHPRTIITIRNKKNRITMSFFIS